MESSSSSVQLSINIAGCSGDPPAEVQASLSTEHNVDRTEDDGFSGEADLGNAYLI